MNTNLRVRALLLASALTLLFAPTTAEAQKALVYCPASDQSGCTTVRSALLGAYPGGVDTGDDGTNGSVDLKTVDLFQYAVVFIPSLAASDSTNPYTLLRDQVVIDRLKLALLGRRAFWSGTPDQGGLTTTRPQKDALIQNLAAWASADFGTVNAPGLVVLQDQSAVVTQRYSWVQPILGFQIVADPKLASYASVRSLTAAGNAILSSNGSTLAYSNMASFGFQTPSGAPGLSMDAVGQTGTSTGGQIVLLTQTGTNTGGAVITTNTDDYPPGTPVIMTGTGFQAGETVSLTLHEDPLLHPDRVHSATADANGGFVYSGFAPEDHDVSVRFVLTAKGQSSGRTAQTTFTDANTFIITPATQDVVAGTTASYTWTFVADNGGNQATTTFTIPNGWTTPQSATPAGAGYISVAGVTSSPCNVTIQGIAGMAVTLAQPGNGCANKTAFTLSYSSATAPATLQTYTFTTSGNGIASPTIKVIAPTSAATSLTVSPASGTYGGTATLTATLTSGSPPGTGVGGKLVTFQLNGSPVCGASPLPTCPSTNPLGIATLSGVSLVGINAGTFANGVSAGFAGDAAFLTSSGTAQLTVNKATATLTIDPASLSATYDGASHAAVVTTAPSGLTGVAVTYDAGTTVPINAGTYAVVAKLTNSNYTATDATANLVIARAQPLFTNLSAPAVTYKANTATISGTLLAGSKAASGSVTVTVAGPGGSISVPAATIDQTNGNFSTSFNPSTLPASLAGYAISLSTGETPNFLAASNNSLSLVVNKASQTISFGALAGKTFGDAAFDVSATASSALAVTFAASGGACSVSMVSVTLTGAGNCTLTAQQAGDGNYLAAPDVQQSFTVAKAAATLSLGTLSAIYDGSGKAVTVTTTPAGLSGVTITYDGAATVPINAGSYAVVAKLVNQNYQATDATGTLVIDKADQTIAWTTPADIIYGTPLSGTQLNATASGGGALTYTPALGTVLNAGAGQTLSVVAAANQNYKSATGSVMINVLKATPTITWTTPTGITYGTLLSATQLNAVGSVPGSLTYSPGAGALLNAGNAQTLSVDFTPSDAANYNNASKTVTIDVAKADQTISWNNPADIVYGTALDGTQLNATVQGVSGGSAAGALSYSPTAGTLLNAGTNQTLTVDAAATQNYNAATKSVQINVAKADPAIVVNGYSGVYDGNAHGATGTATGVGGASLSGLALGASFTNVPGGTANWAFTDVTGNYNDKSGSVQITLTKANPTVSVTGYSGVYDGAPHGATGSVKGAQNEPLSGLDLGQSFTDAPGGTASWKYTDGTGNYNDALGSVTIAIAKAISTTTVTCAAGPFTYTGNAHTPCSAKVQGTPGLNQTLTVSYQNNVNAGTATASASYPTSTNFEASQDSKTFIIDKAGISAPILTDLVRGATGSALRPTETTAPTNVQVTITYRQNNVVVGTSVGTTLSATGGVSAVGVYDVIATITDPNYTGPSADAFFVIYDPSAGFVTGGGFINSPSGACKIPGVCTGATGKANFGFVSKYQNGAKTPTGNTEFQFHNGNLNFKSSVYEWLVVSGARAQFKGDGTVNGQPGYKFLLTAVDGSLNGGGGTDRFRIKIMQTSTSMIVYDNMLDFNSLEGDANASLDNSTYTVLGGGSIQIKTK